MMPKRTSTGLWMPSAAKSTAPPSTACGMTLLSKNNIQQKALHEQFLFRHAEFFSFPFSPPILTFCVRFGTGQTIFRAILSFNNLKYLDICIFVAENVLSPAAKPLLPAIISCLFPVFIPLFSVCQCFKRKTALPLNIFVIFCMHTAGGCATNSEYPQEQFRTIIP